MTPKIDWPMDYYEILHLKIYFCRIRKKKFKFKKNICWRPLRWGVVEEGQDHPPPPSPNDTTAPCVMNRSIYCAAIMTRQQLQANRTSLTAPLASESLSLRPPAFSSSSPWAPSSWQSSKFLLCQIVHGFQTIADIRPRSWKKLF